MVDLYFSAVTVISSNPPSSAESATAAAAAAGRLMPRPAHASKDAQDFELNEIAVIDSPPLFIRKIRLQVTCHRFRLRATRRRRAIGRQESWVHCSQISILLERLPGAAVPPIGAGPIHYAPNWCVATLASHVESAARAPIAAATTDGSRTTRRPRLH